MSGQDAERGENEAGQLLWKLKSLGGLGVREQLRAQGGVPRADAILETGSPRLLRDALRRGALAERTARCFWTALPAARGASPRAPRSSRSRRSPEIRARCVRAFPIAAEAGRRRSCCEAMKMNKSGETARRSSRDFTALLLYVGKSVRRGAPPSGRRPRRSPAHRRRGSRGCARWACRRSALSRSGAPRRRGRAAAPPSR